MSIFVISLWLLAVDEKWKLEDFTPIYSFLLCSLFIVSCRCPQPKTSDSRLHLHLGFTAYDLLAPHEHCKVEGANHQVIKQASTVTSVEGSLAIVRTLHDILRFKGQG